MRVSTDFINYNFEGLCGSINSYIREHTSWPKVGIRYHLGKYFSPKCKGEKAKKRRGGSNSLENKNRNHFLGCQKAMNWKTSNQFYETMLTFLFYSFKGSSLNGFFISYLWIHIAFCESNSSVFFLICLVAERSENQSLSNSSMGGASWKLGHKILGKGKESWINWTPG